MAQARASQESLGKRAARFLRSLLVGAAATIADTLVLETLTRAFGVNATVAKAFALVTGVLVQFLGSRYFAFKATHGMLGRQLKLFVLCEVVTVTLSLGVFHGLHWLATRYMPFLSLEAAQFLSGAVVYFGFSYPMWKRVFALTPEEQERALQARTA